MNIQTIGVFMLVMGVMCILTIALFWLFITDSWSQERRDRAWKKFIWCCKVYTVIAILLIASPLILGEVTIVLAIPLYFVLRWVWSLK